VLAKVVKFASYRKNNEGLRGKSVRPLELSLSQALQSGLLSAGMSVKNEFPVPVGDVRLVPKVAYFAPEWVAWFVRNGGIL
jgi:hypothetical protein